MRSVWIVAGGVCFAATASAHDEKMEDAVRNGLSLSVSTCFNVYVQNASVPGQEPRLERCILNVMAAHAIARRLLDRKEVSDAGQRPFDRPLICSDLSDPRWPGNCVPGDRVLK